LRKIDLRSGWRQRRCVKEWTATVLRGTKTATASRGTATATVTELREGWQRKNVDLQKPKGLGERRMERENTMDFFFFLGVCRYF
jgi:hypothetical protein